MNTRWTYYLEGTQVHPLNTRSLRIKETLEDEYIHDYRKSLEGSIVLMNDYKNNHLDYDFIKGLETTKLHEKLTFQMHDGGTLAFTGEFTILDCKFNERQGICEFQVQPVDD
ncbi:MAG: hypothetical protein JW833_03685, partial [Prolixibacteraceae bacterium]|nr:hypothetical protein [Prolixibacteraceae bacterium]